MKFRDSRMRDSGRNPGMWAAVRDFYGEYKDDPRGSEYLRLELRA